MHRALAWFTALVLIALGGCEANVGPPGTPGSVTGFVHGRVESGFSVRP